MSRKRPKSLDAPVVMQARRLEVWAYVRCDQWKRTYRHTLVNDFRKHITDAKNEIIRAFELPNKMRNEKAYHYEWLIIAVESVKGKSSKPCYVFFMLHRIEELVRLAHQVGNCEVLPTERTVRRAERSTGWLLAHSGNIQSTLNSYLGFLKWCNSYRLRHQVCDRVRGSVLGMVLEPAEDNHKVTIRRGYTKTSYYKREYKELKHMLAA